MAASSPDASSSIAALSGAEWTMTEVKSKPVRPADKDHRQIVLAFDTDRSTFSGASGCNNLAGRFALIEGTLTLKPDRSLRICRVDQRTERAVRSVIDDTCYFRVPAMTLELLDDKGRRLAKLER